MDRQRIERQLAEYQRVMQAQAALFDLLRMEGRIAALTDLLASPDEPAEGREEGSDD